MPLKLYTYASHNFRVIYAPYKSIIVGYIGQTALARRIDSNNIISKKDLLNASRCVL